MSSAVFVFCILCITQSLLGEGSVGRSLCSPLSEKNLGF